jgi:energy-coupling factor transport system permease protein
MILMTLLLTSTTKSLDIAFAFEWFLSPLKLVKFPVSNLALVMSLALRFIPLILEETQRIKKAQESRGVEFEKGNIFKRIKCFVSILVPLMISSYETSIQMADAMEVRGFVSNQKRTKYNVRKFGWNDALALIFLVVCCSGLYFVSWANYDLINAIFGYKDAITILR